MQIIKPVTPPPKTEQKPEQPAPTPQPEQPSETSTLPKRLPTRPEPIVQPRPVQPPFAQPIAPEEQVFDDGIRMRDPNTGQVLATELDQVQMDYLGGDPLRAVYQGLVWAAESLKKLAMTTPALAGLSPQAETIIDQVATIGYQVTNAGAELTRGLWNWPLTRVVINQQLEQVIHPEEWGTFNRLYKEYYEEIIGPVETGQAKYEPAKIKDWMGKRTNEIADPGGFVKLCAQRYAMEKVAAKSAWTPTDIFSTTKPLGMRQSTTTGLEAVFRKKPG